MLLVPTFQGSRIAHARKVEQREYPRYDMGKPLSIRLYTAYLRRRPPLHPL